VIPSPKGATVLVESGTFGDLCDHRCTLNALFKPGRKGQHRSVM
jgi:hypothetical protein